MENMNLYITQDDYAKLLPIIENHPLSDELDRAIVVPKEQISSTIVQLNSLVTYLDESNGVSRQVELVLPESADMEKGRVSVLAPVGTALFGLEEGQTIEWPFPSGATRHLKVVSSVAPYHYK
jgi:regulator of nucleoside diphosphate kinase